MCLNVVKKDWPFEQESVTFYKIVKKGNKKLISPFFCYFKWKVGENELKWDKFTSPERIETELVNGFVSHGLHVFINEEDAKSCLKQCFEEELSTHFVVKVTGKRENFIAYGLWGDDKKTEQVAFTKLELSQEEYDVIMQQ